MALPASPPLSMSQVYAEFGGAGQPLTAFVRGGAYVPDTPTNAGVPTAPPINLLQLLGASAYVATVFLQDESRSANNVNANATAELRFGATQVQSRANGGSLANEFQWLLSGARSDYEVRGTVITGLPTTGPVGTWTSLGADVVWTLLRTAAGSISCSGTIEIRPAGGGATLATATFTLTATRTNE